MIYFITAREAGQVKIGYTDGEPKRRLTQLQIGCPHKLALEAVIEGDAAFEKELHERWGSFRRRGEWFTLVPGIDLTIRMCAGQTEAEARRSWVRDQFAKAGVEMAQ